MVWPGNYIYMNCEYYPYNCIILRETVMYVPKNKIFNTWIKNWTTNQYFKRYVLKLNTLRFRV